RLRFVQVGATRCTTRRWLAEFFGRLTAASDGAPSPPPDRAPSGAPLAPRTAAARRRAVEAAERELDRLAGWKARPKQTPRAGDRGARRRTSVEDWPWGRPHPQGRGTFMTVFDCTRSSGGVLTPVSTSGPIRLHQPEPLPHPVLAAALEYTGLRLRVIPL